MQDHMRFKYVEFIKSVDVGDIIVTFVDLDELMGDFPGITGGPAGVIIKYNGESRVFVPWSNIKYADFKERENV